MRAMGNPPLALPWNDLSAPHELETLAVLAAVRPHNRTGSADPNLPSRAKGRFGHRPPSLVIGRLGSTTPTSVRYATSFLTLANGLRRSQEPKSTSSCRFPVMMSFSCSLARAIVV